MVGSEEIGVTHEEARVADVVVLKSLDDMWVYVGAACFEHPAFRTFWNEAGTVGRATFARTYGSSALINEVQQEARELRERVVGYRKPLHPSWAPIFAAIADF